MAKGADEPGLTVTVMVGLVGSGKSSYVRRALPRRVHVELDAVRRCLFGQAYYARGEPLLWHFAEVMVRSLYVAGHLEIVVDDCHATRASRARWFSSKWRTAMVFMDVPDEQCVVPRGLGVAAHEISRVFEPPSPSEWRMGTEPQIMIGRQG